MGRAPRQLPEPVRERHARLKPDAVLDVVLSVATPLLRLMLAAGVRYPQLMNALKWRLLEVAHDTLMRDGQADTDSALSVLTGIHRKDVRAWREGRLPAPRERSLPLGSQVFAHWIGGPQYRDRRGRPKALPRIGPDPSFESLSRAVTLDVHPHSVLQELRRLNLVKIQQREDGDWIVPAGDGFVPEAGVEEMLILARGSVEDHAATAVANVLGEDTRLEQSVFADGLTEESAAELGTLARDLWRGAQRVMLAAALQRHDADQSRSKRSWRIRFGAYFWSVDNALGTVQPDEKTRD